MHLDHQAWTQQCPQQLQPGQRHSLQRGNSGPREHQGGWPRAILTQNSDIYTCSIGPLWGISKPMELQRHYLSPRVTSITPGNTPLTYAFQPLKPLPEPTLEVNRDYLIPTKPYSPEILKQDLSLHNKWSYKSQGVKQTSNIAQDNTFCHTQVIWNHHTTKRETIYR